MSLRPDGASEHVARAGDALKRRTTIAPNEERTFSESIRERVTGRRRSSHVAPTRAHPHAPSAGHVAPTPSTKRAGVDLGTGPRRDELDALRADVGERAVAVVLESKSHSGSSKGWASRLSGSGVKRDKR
jgi:hypothetical protein